MTGYFKKIGDKSWTHMWAAAVVLLAAVIVPSPSFAARPLITDDAGTVGMRKFQTELGVESSSWKDTTEGVSEKETGTETSSVFTYGLTENIDLVAGFAYAWNKIKENGETVFDDNGFKDTSFEVKWRFFERAGYAFAVKPGITFPTGNEDKGFGGGRNAYGITFIASKEMKPLAFHLNVGYTRNENKVDERNDLWAASAAVSYEAIDRLNLVGDIGFETNPDPTVATVPSWALVGLNYGITENITVDAGFKLGLNKQEVDYAVITGMTFVF